jgi:hypothetical protein
LAPPFHTQEEKVQRKFGFLYKGYREHYWETVEMLRKLVIAAIPVFLPVVAYGSVQVCAPTPIL